ncbi:caspase family protein [Fibrella aquatilis]|uniref:Caspase family protein n=1 Tax=Fibrella aquatilis TaxID=2817059 RepID=A0A939K047_9BACT|nr:caspase family protein [Fibrella aquatilis]MBO0933819.1 caspase family protein [Fibrella aquatilis]
MLRPLSCFVLLCLAGFQSAPPANRFALLIAIGNYPARSGAEPIHATNDSRLMSQLLVKQGFDIKNSRVLADAQATRRGIVQAFDSLARCLPVGSRVVIHFSGHGLQLADDNHDEADGLDEAILPYDGQANQPATLIRDDELGRWLGRLRLRLGPAGHLLLLFDSCHSGSILRNKPGQQVGRGVAMQLSRSAVEAPAGTSGWFETATSPSAETKLGRYVLLAATTDGQSSFECTDAGGKAYGPLTLAACQAWSAMPNPGSYRAFFGAVQQQMSRLAPYQLPTLEGNADAPFLGY